MPGWDPSECKADPGYEAVGANYRQLSLLETRLRLILSGIVAASRGTQRGTQLDENNIPISPTAPPPTPVNEEEDGANERKLASRS